MNAWGFKYSTIVFVWVKLTNKKKPVRVLSPWTMKSCEIAILGTKGKAKSTLLKTQNQFQLITALRREHSRKPINARQRLEKMFGDCERIILFSRAKVHGWDVLGNQLEKFESD